MTQAMATLQTTELIDKRGDQGDFRLESYWKLGLPQRVFSVRVVINKRGCTRDCEVAKAYVFGYSKGTDNVTGWHEVYRMLRPTGPKRADGTDAVRALELHLLQGAANVLSNDHIVVEVDE